MSIGMGDGQKNENGGGGGGGNFGDNSKDALLVVVTLITTLSYQLGTNIPGGFWQDDGLDHMAGDPIMRDRHRMRYWLFMTASWVSFGSSMLVTATLLVQVVPRSRLVRWPFVVAYSGLVLSFITSQPRTSLTLDIVLWAVVMVVLAVVINCKHLNTLCSCDKGKQQTTATQLPAVSDP